MEKKKNKASEKSENKKSNCYNVHWAIKWGRETGLGATVPVVENRGRETI